MNQLMDDVDELRNAGFSREADIVELTATSSDAAALVRRFTSGWWLEIRTRLRYTAVLVAVVMSVAIHPLLPSFLILALVALGVAWFARRRRAIGEDGWNLLVDWWLEPLRNSPPHQLLLLIFSLFMVVVGLAESNPAQTLVSGLVVIGTMWLAARAARGGRRNSTAQPTSLGGSPRPLPSGAAGESGTVVAEQVTVEHPRLLLAVLSTLPLIVAGVAITLTAELQTSVVLAVALTASALLLGWRISRTMVRFDDQGVVYASPLRTRRWDWDQIRSVRAKDDGDDRARVELVPVRERDITIWSGSIDHPLLVRLVSFGEAHAAGTAPAKRSLWGCLTVVLWAVALIGAVSIGGMLQSPALVPVDPATVPDRVQVERDSDDTGKLRYQPYVYCARAFSDPDGWEPPGCADERAGQELFIVVMGLATSVAATGLVLSRRRARRDGRPAPEGPIS